MSLRRHLVIPVLVSVCPGYLHAAQQPLEIPVVRLESMASQPPAQLPSLPVTRLDDRPPAANLDGTRSVSLTFSNPLPVRDVLLLLLRGTPFSIVFDPGAAGTFVGELSDLTLRESLEAVLSPAGLDYSLKGSVIRVFPRRPETRLFELDRVDVTRSWRRRVRSLTTGDGATPAADLSSAVESDFFRELGDGIRALLSQSGGFHLDRKAGLVQVTDFADRLDQIAVYLEAVTLRAARQVRLQARVLEVTLSDAFAVDWTAVANRPGSGGRAGGGAGIRIDDFDALLRAIGAFGAVRMIAAPQMVAMNNEPAVIHVGSQHATFAAPAVHLDAGEPGQPAGIIEGLRLTIVPQIGADGIVQMSVSPTYTGRSRASGPPAPTAIVESDTTLRVQQGETVVISGLIRDVVDEVPASGLPGVFGRRDRLHTRTELIILLTPTVVNPGSGPAAGAQ